MVLFLTLWPARWFRLLPGLLSMNCTVVSLHFVTICPKPDKFPQPWLANLHFQKAPSPVVASVQHLKEKSSKVQTHLVGLAQLLSFSTENFNRHQLKEARLWAPKLICMMNKRPDNKYKYIVLKRRIVCTAITLTQGNLVSKKQEGWHITCNPST